MKKWWIDARFRGISMADLAPSVHIMDVEEAEPSASIQHGANAGYSGSRFLGMYRETLDVVITFVVYDKNRQRRQQALDRVRMWARGVGELELSYRPGQVLRCRGGEGIGVPSVQKWADALTVTFTAYAVPYWIDRQINAAYSSEETTSHSLGLSPSGTAERCPMAFSLTAAAAVTSFTIRNTSTDTGMTFSGLSMSAGQTAEASYADGLLAVKIGDTSILSKRTPASSDDIWLRQRAGNEITATADGACTLVCTARGLYL